MKTSLTQMTVSEAAAVVLALRPLRSADKLQFKLKKDGEKKASTVRAVKKAKLTTLDPTKLSPAQLAELRKLLESSL